MVKIDAPARRVIVGPREALRQTDIRVSGLNWLGDAEADETPQPVFVKIRSARPPVPGEIWRDEQGAMVRISAGEFGVSPGQAVYSTIPMGWARGCWVAARLPAPGTRSAPQPRHVAEIDLLDYLPQAPGAFL